MMRRDGAGFTLIELLMTMVIVAILAAIALPSYQWAVRKGNRADAMAALLKIQLAEESWRANNPTYTALVANLGLGSTSERGLYAITITAPVATAATGYIATATALNDQLNDTNCAIFSLNIRGANESRLSYLSNGVTLTTGCW